MSKPLNELIFSEREFLYDLQKVCTKWNVEIDGLLV